MDTSNNSHIAQFVILDVGVPNPAQVSEAVLSSVVNILCVSQGSHIPAVGLGLINASYQPVIRLSSTQSSLKLWKILHAINSVKETGKCRARISMEEFQDCVHLGIKTVIEDFESLSNQLTDEEVCPDKIQITIISMRDLSEIPIHIQKALPFFKMHFVFKIMVVELVEDFLDLDCLRRDQKVTTNLEYLQVAGTVRNIDELMKQWLTFEDTHQHLKLVLQNLDIWCDSRECLIRPALSSSLEPSQDSLEELVDEEEVLMVINKLPTEGVCETHMFGDPVMLTPCRWQLHFNCGEYEGLTHNTKCFLDLCNKLGTSDEYLVAKYEKRNQPIRFVLLMPGSGFLLAKELVSSEMAFPVSDLSKRLSTLTTPEVDSSVTTALVCLPTISSYDPGDFSSGLYKLLQRKILQSKPVKTTQEPLSKNPLHDSIIGCIEVKKKTKLKRKSSSGWKHRRHPGCELPILTERDQQTLNECFTKYKKKCKLTFP